MLFDENLIIEIYEYLQKGWGNDSQSQKEYMQKLCSYKAYINQMKAFIEEIYLEKISEFVESTKEKKLKNYETADKKTAFCKNELILKAKIDRISSSINHSIDGLKAILFLQGQEVKAIGGF